MNSEPSILRHLGSPGSSGNEGLSELEIGRCCGMCSEEKVALVRRRPLAKSDNDAVAAECTHKRPRPQAAGIFSTGGNDVLENS